MQRNLQNREEPFLKVGSQSFAAAKNAPELAATRCSRLVQERIQHGGNEVRGGHLRGADKATDIGWIPVSTRPCDHQTGTLDQRPKEFPDRNIENRRRFLQYPIV